MVIAIPVQPCEEKRDALELLSLTLGQLEPEQNFRLGICLYDDACGEAHCFELSGREEGGASY
ncbi:hypothetical protein MLD63_17680 [Paracoccus sp. TK19116]|uniref:Uncharacterized protein n=1 Tax=Paracoccus albicereus TaxID=2922394 RepID=A0ABT1MVA9_9RHOB|nr:hypothetical protein [Paracoccus albicereus]MCQ0972250.1 hypothetical protein [Paracoccus albicereus]